MLPTNTRNQFLYPPPNRGTPAARGRPATTTVRGQPPAPGQACVVVITMGEHIQLGLAAGRAKGIIEVGSHHCLIIEIGLDLDEARAKLQSHVPADAMVFLITDAPLDEVARVRAALPKPENVIDEVKVDDRVDVIAPPVYRALQNLLDARRATAADSQLPQIEHNSARTQGQAMAGQPSRRDDWRTEASDMVHAYEAAVAAHQAGATSDTAFRAGLGDLDHHDPRERSGYASPSIPSPPSVNSAFPRLMRTFCWANPPGPPWRGTTPLQPVLQGHFRGLRPPAIQPLPCPKR